MRALLLLLFPYVLLSVSAITYSTDYDSYDGTDLYGTEDVNGYDVSDNYDTYADYADDSYDTSYSDNHYGSSDYDSYDADNYELSDSYGYNDYEPMNESYGDYDESYDYGHQDYEPSEYTDQYYDYYDDQGGKYGYTDYGATGYEYTDYEPINYGYTDTYGSDFYDSDTYGPYDYDYGDYQLAEYGLDRYYKQKGADSHKHRHYEESNTYDHLHQRYGQPYTYNEKYYPHFDKPAPDYAYTDFPYKDYAIDQYSAPLTSYHETYYDLYDPHAKARHGEMNSYSSLGHDDYNYGVYDRFHQEPYIKDYYSAYDSFTESKKVRHGPHFNADHKGTDDTYRRLFDNYEEGYAHHPKSEGYNYDYSFTQYDHSPMEKYNHYDNTYTWKHAQPYKGINHEGDYSPQIVYPKKQQQQQQETRKHYQHHHKKTRIDENKHKKDQTSSGYTIYGGKKAKHPWSNDKYLADLDLRYPEIGKKSGGLRDYSVERKVNERSKFDLHKHSLKSYSLGKQPGYVSETDSGYGDDKWYKEEDKSIKKYNKGLSYPGAYHDWEIYGDYNGATGYGYKGNGLGDDRWYKEEDKSIKKYNRGLNYPGAYHESENYGDYSGETDYGYRGKSIGKSKGNHVPIEKPDYHNYQEEGMKSRKIYDDFGEHDKFGKSDDYEGYGKKFDYQEEPSHGQENEDYGNGEDLSMKSQDDLDAQLLKDATYRLKSGLKGRGKFLGIGSQEKGTKYEQVTTFHHGGSIDKYGKQNTHYGGYDTKGSVKNYGEERSKQQHFMEGTLKAVGLGDDYDKTRAKGKFNEKQYRRDYDGEEHRYAKGRRETRKSRDSRNHRGGPYDEY